MPEINKLVKFILYADDANIILTGSTINEIEQQFNELAKVLVEWVSLNGLSLNVRKTNYMLFSCHKTVDYDNFTPKIAGRTIEKKSTARFLGILIDDKLNWIRHVASIKAKMSRYIGVLYKLKGTLPISARKNLYHSFVQSHINYCSLVWGLSSKNNIEMIFRTQKKAVRATIPGFINYFFKDGITPLHTKPSFNEYNILTIHNIIAKNVMIFMNKVHNSPSLLPPSIKNLIPDNAPIPGSTHETCLAWIDCFRTIRLRNSLFYKGPLLFAELIGLRETYFVFSTANTFKASIKRYLFNLQTNGDDDEWQYSNFKIYTIKGLRRSERKVITRDIDG